MLTVKTDPPSYLETDDVLIELRRSHAYGRCTRPCVRAPRTAPQLRAALHRGVGRTAVAAWLGDAASKQRRAIYAPRLSAEMARAVVGRNTRRDK